MSGISANDALSTLFDAMRYAKQQASNESLNPENREMYLQDAGVLEIILDAIDQQFGRPDPLHHWFYRGDFRD